MKNIGRRLKTIRQIRGYTQLYVAEQYERITGSPTTQTTVSCWESGDRRIYADQLYALSQIYKVTPMSLLTDDTGECEPRLVTEIDNLDRRHKETLLFAATEWDGDSSALIENTRVYMSLPKFRRRRIVEYELYEYFDAYRLGELLPNTPAPDTTYIRKKADELRKELTDDAL